MPARPRRARALAPLGVALLLFLPCVLGFGLDESELKCELTAAALEGCCPPELFNKRSCRQVSGCGASNEATVLTIDESTCLQAASCEAITAKDVCARIAKRIELAAMGGAPPTMEEIHAGGSLCDGL